MGVIAISVGQFPLLAQPFAKGSITDNFTLTDRRTGEPVSLSDFEGQIVVLDFFAFWCAPCAFSSPDIEENIQRYYKDLGGNPNGVPVQVISVNIEPSDPASTDTFIASVGADLVVDDPDALAWNFYNQTDGIPLFVIINGVENSPSHAQWEVLHNAPSYPGGPDRFREIINSVEAGLPPEDPFETAIDLGENWKWISNIGTFHDLNAPWIFHEEHGWMYKGEGNLNTGQFLFDLTMGWMWTTTEIYPKLYSLDRNSWLIFEEGTNEPREFFDTTLGESFSILNNIGFDPIAQGVFNLRNTTIPNSQIVQGQVLGGIPEIDNPVFVSISGANGFMTDNDIVLSVSSGGVTRAYPFRILNWHEIVNDQIGDDHFVVTYCPLCGTGIVFESEFNGRVRTFGVSGLLFQNNLLMYDKQTFSLWSQFSLRSMSGTMIKSRLKWKSSEQMTYGDWKQKYPNGTVLSTETGFSRDYDRNPYADYFENDQIIFPSGPIRDDLPQKAWIWGIEVENASKAYPIFSLTDGVPFRDTVNGIELELTVDIAALSVKAIVIETGQPLDNGVAAFWFSWQDFYPETLVYVP